MREIDKLFTICMERNASDLHLVVGRPPVLRIGSILENIEGEKLKPADIEKISMNLLTDAQKKILEKKRELDFAISIPGVSRFRGNIHYQRGSVAAAFRALPLRIPTLEELRLPVKVLTQMANRKSGLVLVTGPTGAGKSTTLASVIDLINTERKCHIITIEDPLEYIHSHKMSIVQQREVHEDTLSFASALKHVLRQDPDVILVGEMRDLETFSATMTAAETGHLVFSTLHTKDAIQTVDRIISVFPAHQQEQARVQLAGALEGIIAQRLIPMPKGNGLIPAFEVLTATDATRSLIREGRTHLIPSTIESGAKYDMISMDRSLVNLYKQGLISKELLMRNCVKPDYVMNLMNAAQASETPRQKSRV
ncbi:MAG: type IV pilus twitching motility protein PilT [Nitrospiraceae bacterium]|nr:MAG: type IV pilus twitching motility protein PilT [Nitrospiraceae bacterium]